jgi:2-oxo-4-hydroxy-4-carboxy--5-ureidoimidazoline (OHCU) decarboxylase
MPAAGDGVVTTGPAASTAIFVIDTLPAPECVIALVPFFEGAPGFLRRLVDARPFGSAATLFERAREVALSMPEDEQIELLDAHPRLGAAPESVSRLSFTEQGYDRAPVGGDVAATAATAATLAGLNAEYEERFGFRYCVFVAGRSRAALIPEFEAAFERDRDGELRRGIGAVIDIAADRYWKRGDGEARS